ncbi:hypothetical protein ACOMHN_015907 [Nucella lapillus]
MLLAKTARATAADPEDVVMCRKELKAALLPDDTLDQHRQRADRQDRSCHWGYDVTDAAALLHQDDVTVYMGRVVGVEGGGGEGKRVAVPLRELTDRVERRMKEVTENTHTLTSQLTSCTEDFATLQKKGDDLEKEVERKTGELQKKGDDLERKTGELQKKGDDLERKTGELQKKGDDLEKEVERKTGELQKKGDDLERKTGELQKKGDDLERKTGELQKKGDDLEKKAGELQKKGDDLEKKAGELQKKGDDLERKTGELQKKGDDLERKTGELQKKGDDLEKEVERKITSLQDDITTSRKTEADLQSLAKSLKKKMGNIFHCLA